MKYVGVALVALFVFVLVFSSDGQDQTSNESASNQTVLAYSDVQQDVDTGGAAFLDVRTPEEYYESHFPGAELFPLQDLERGGLPDYETNTTMYVYCRSGNRSQDATRILEAAGYNVVDLGGLPDVTAIGGTLTEDTCPLGDVSLCLERDSASDGA